MSNERCDHAAAIVRIDEAFRAGDLSGLIAATNGRWVVPNGPMPIEIGQCLEYSIYHSPLAFVRELLELGADTKPSHHSGFPPLIAALWQNPRPDPVPIVELLLSFGADPDQRGMNDYTALHVAVIERRADVVALLLEHGADRALRTRIDNLESALDLAVEIGDPSIVDLLRRRAGTADARQGGRVNE